MANPTSAARNSLFIMLTRIGTLPLALLSSSLIARVLQPELRGYFGFLLLYNALWLPIASLGFGGSAIYLISKKRYTPQSAITTILLQGFLQGMFLMLVIGLLRYANWLGASVNNLAPEIFWPIVLMLPLQGMFLMGSRVLIGDSWFSMNNTFTLLSALLPLVLQVIALLIWPWWLGETLFAEVQPENFAPLQRAVIANVIAQTILTVSLIAVLGWRYRPHLNWNQPYQNECFTYGYKVWWGDMTARANLRGDQQIFGAMRANEMPQFGQYAIAVTLSEMLWHLPDSINYVLFNKISAAETHADQIQLTEQVHRMLFWTMLVLILCVAAAAPTLLWLLYGEKYLPAVQPLWWLLPGTLALTTTKVMTKYLGGSGKPGLSSLTTVVGTIVGLVSCVLSLLLTDWGINGVAAASSLGYFASAVLSVYLFRREIAPRKTHLFQLVPHDWHWLRKQTAGI